MMRVNLKTFLLELLASFLLDRAKRKLFSRRSLDLPSDGRRGLTGPQRCDRIPPSEES